MRARFRGRDDGHRGDARNQTRRLKLFALPRAERDEAREVLAIVSKQCVGRVGERKFHPLYRGGLVLDFVNDQPRAGALEPVGADGRR